MQKKLNFNFQIILDEQFSLTPNGYSIDEVNKFLDNIGDDYKLFEKIVRSYEAKIINKEKKISHLEQNIDIITNEKTLLKKELSEIKRGGITDYGGVLKRLAKVESDVSHFGEILDQKFDKVLLALREINK